jgi:mRNA-degrading endonuclease RelE of RelBE toxin-antitoxin system
MDKIEKALQRLSGKEREWVREVLMKLGQGEPKGLDIKKLKGREDIFRVRRGGIRIIYRVENSSIYILAIERRNEETYKKF